ncbi:hypothetical protein [Acinetobacter sp. MD2(2019)]|nr:hypothetical protein [Acinetobacter sp. MD2(2019)]MEB3754542.1 hypothetical protein [Acinetobacter sp. MD2(2019)]
MNFVVNPVIVKQHIKPMLHTLKWIVGWSIFYSGAFVFFDHYLMHFM